MRDDALMRTTIDIDDDVLLAAKELARKKHATAGRIISDLARSAMTASVSMKKDRHGFPQIASRQSAKPVTMELVNRLRDEDA
jgi:hypothetical protein